MTLPLNDPGEHAVALALEAGLPFVGLRGRAIDARLLAYLPAGIVREERILPIELDGDRLLVACDRPDPVLESIAQAFPALTVEVAIAPADELEIALAALEVR